MNKTKYNKLTKDYLRKNPTYARLLSPLQNGVAGLQKGQMVRLESKSGGFSIVSIPFPPCDISVRITRVPYQLVEIVEDFDPKKRDVVSGTLSHLVEEIAFIYASENPVDQPKLIRSKIATYLEKEIARFAKAADTSRGGSAPDGGFTKEEAINFYRRLAPLKEAQI